jgi:alpha-beta hydrolase superfamily lysophospholipase
MPSVVSHATAPDGLDLLVRHWPVADGGDAWASLLLIHGLGEHSGRYEHVGDQMAAAGIETWAYDHRGNGASGGRRGHVDRWSEYHDDVASRLGAVRTSAEGRPVVLYGHSMGGLIVAGYLLGDDLPPDRPMPDLVVLSSPGLDSTLARWKVALAPVIGRMLPTLSVPNGIDPATLSRDPSVGEIADRDPLNGKASTAGFAAEAVAEQARVRRLATRGFGRPTLVLHGLDDGLVPSTASEVFAQAPDTERRTYPGLRHELHNEPEGRAIEAEVIAWLRERATLPPHPNTASGERLER